MRLLVSADIHLGSPIRSAALRNPDLAARLKQASRDTFAALIDLAIAQEVDAVVLAGDLFDNDHPDLKSRAFLIAQLARAVRAGIPAVLIRGNHDALLDHRQHGDLGADIHLLHKGAPTVQIGGVAFHGLSFEASHQDKSFLPDYPAPVPGLRNVGLMHSSLDGAPGHDPYAPCATRDLMAHGYDLWCLGHIHAPFERQDGPVLAVMPGIPQPRHFGERWGGSVTLVELGDSDAPQFQRHPLGRLGFAACEVDLSERTDQQQVLASLREVFLANHTPGRDTALRLRVISDRFASELVAGLAMEVLDDLDGLYLDKVISTPRPRALGPETDDLLRLMREERQEPGFRHAASALLEDLRLALPPGIADELAPDRLDALLDEALAEVSRAVHAEGTE